MKKLIFALSVMLGGILGFAGVLIAFEVKFAGLYYGFWDQITWGISGILWLILLAATLAMAVWGLVAAWREAFGENKKDDEQT